MKAVALSIFSVALGALFSFPLEDRPVLQLVPATGYNTEWSSAAPPLRFTRDVRVTVVFVRDVERHCETKPPKDMTIAACFFPGRALMVLPHPCPAALNDRFSSIACHEIGHANGWGHNHEE